MGGTERCATVLLPLYVLYLWYMLQELEDLKTAEPRSGDGKVLHCIKGPLAWPHQGEPIVTTFKLDRLADVLYIFTRGQSLSGNVVITQDERTEDLDLLYVDVAPIHATPNWLHAVSVCSLSRGPDEMGIGIFVGRFTLHSNLT